jgi:hypothetical protein
MLQPGLSVGTFAKSCRFFSEGRFPGQLFAQSRWGRRPESKRAQSNIFHALLDILSLLPKHGRSGLAGPEMAKVAKKLENYGLRSEN